MNQSFDVQLQVSLRALNDVIAPILVEANADKHAVEQLHLVLATLSFLKQRLHEARRFARAELRTYTALAAEASELVGGDTDLVGAVEAAERMLNSAEADTHDIEKTTRAVREQITACFARSVGEPFATRFEALILKVSGDHVDQCRQWCAPFGFEPRPEMLPNATW